MNMTMKDFVVKGLTKVIEEQANELHISTESLIEMVKRESGYYLNNSINDSEHGNTKLLATIDDMDYNSLYPDVKKNEPDHASEQLASTIIRGIVPDAMNVGMVWTFDDILRETEFMVKRYENAHIDFMSGKKLYNMILKQNIADKHIIEDVYQRDIITGQYMIIRSWHSFEQELVKQYEYK